MNKLIPLIEKHGYTLQEFADLCEISLKTIYNWDETGIVRKIKHRELLKKTIPEFDPKPPIKKALTEEELKKLKPPKSYYKKEYPKVGIPIKIVKKSSSK